MKIENLDMCRRGFLRQVAVVLLAEWSVSGLRAEQAKELKIMFNVPAGEAIKSLRQAARQAKVEFILSAEIVRKLKTRRVKGNYTPLEAFNLMLSGTHLVVFHHKESGAYAIRKENKDSSNRPKTPSET